MQEVSLHWICCFTGPRQGKKGSIHPALLAVLRALGAQTWCRWNQGTVCAAASRCGVTLESWGGQDSRGRTSITLLHWTTTKHTTLSLGRLSLTCLQLEVVRRERLPGRGQGCNGLKMQHVLLHVCRGVTDPVGNEPFNYSSWYKNQSPPRNVVTNRDITRLLQDFNLKHTGKRFLFWFCLQFNRCMMGLLIPNKAPSQAFCMCLKDQCHTELVREL